MFFSRGHVLFFLGGGMHRIRRDTVNERAVRILLECILVDLFCYRSITALPLSTGSKTHHKICGISFEPFGFPERRILSAVHRTVER